MKTHLKSGFSLIELVVVILILSILAGAIVPRVSNRMSAARDGRRLTDVKAIQAAIEQYHMDKGVYPPAKKNNSVGGWDVSYDGDFIPELVQTGYLREIPRDPTNDTTYHYRYYVYSKGSYGCQGDGDYYVLGVRRFETDAASAETPGYFECSGRNWGLEFDYVTGGGASLK